MKKALHGVSVNHCNAVTQLRIARETGYDALEILPDHLFRYLDNGGSLEKFRELMAHYRVEINCINALTGIGCREETARRDLFARAETLCHAAQQLACPVVQILAVDEIATLSEAERTETLVQNISAIADIGKKYDVKFQIEVIAFTPFNSLKQALAVIAATGADNVGVVVDFWHLYAAGQTTPDEVAALDPSLIYGVHFCDGRRPAAGEKWDQCVQRDYLPGDGEVDLAEWTRAVKATGYDGVWSPELHSPTNWEDDLWQVAQTCKTRMDRYIN